VNSFGRGGLMAYYIDQQIRSQTNNAKSIQDAMLALVEWTKVNQKAWQIEQLPGIFQNATGMNILYVNNN
jgi:predicted metalloprotease with PDZ domain